MFFFVSTVLNFASTVLNFASTVFFFVSTVLNFASTVFFFVSIVLNHRQGGVRSYVTLAPNSMHQQTRTPNNRQQHTTTVHNSTLVHKNTNVPLFKKLFDIIFFWWENHFMSHFEGHFEGVKRGVKGSKGVCAVNFLALLILLKGKV